MSISDRDRRLVAFLLDGLVVVSLGASVAALAYGGRGVLAVLAAIATGAGLTWLVGRHGASPGKATVGLRVVSAVDQRPIGFARALVRAGVVALVTVPTLGLGAVGLAWSALVDPSGRRRGWHDLCAGSVVVDVRPRSTLAQPVAPAPELVNLTLQ